MIALGEDTRVYLAVGATDLRKSIDAFSALVVDVLHHDPCCNQVFVFCNRGRNKLKALLWRRNGFWLCYRRLERERFAWPSAVPGEVAVTLAARELRFSDTRILRLAGLILRSGILANGLVTPSTEV